MTYDLIKVRVQSFLTELLAAVTFILVGFFSSPQFSTLVNEHFGQTVVSTLILLAMNGILKHVRNMAVLSDYHAKFGSSSAVTPPNLI